MCRSITIFRYPSTYRNVNSQFKNNLCEKAKHTRERPTHRPGRDIHYNRNGRLFTVLYYSVRSSRSSALRYGLPSCMSVNYLWDGGGLGGSARPPSPYSYNPRRPLPRYIWKSRWPPLTVRRAIFRRSHEKIGDCEQSTEMAVFTLETDYSCETGYPFDDSRQIGKYVLIWKWSSFNFEWTIRLTLSFNFDGQFEDGIIRSR